jgi:hypothetical protein
MKQIIILSALFLLASVSLSAQVVKGAGLWYFNGVPNVTPSTGTGTEVAYSINNKALYKWNRTTSAWVVVVQDSSITNELQDLILSGDTLSLTLSDSIVLMAQYRNHVWEIAALSDTTSITGDIEGDIAYVTGGDTIAFRDASFWLPFTGGGGGGTFNSFNIAGDTGSSVVTDGQTVTVAGGYGINTVESGGTVTVTADTSQLATQSDISGFGTMSSFTVAGGSGTPQTITNGNTLTLSEGYGINTLAAATDNVRTEVDTTQIATQFDISGLPSGSGTNQRIVVWTGTNSQGNSTQLQSAAGVTLDANLAYRITGGTTASRPTGAAGMQYWNTSNGWLDIHNGTAWFNPARSSTSNGLFTNGSVLFGGADGTISQDNTGIFFEPSANQFGLGTAGTISIGEFGAQMTVQGSLPIIGSYRPSSTVGQGTGFQVVMNSATSVATTLAYFNGYMINNTAGAVSGGLAFFTRNAGSLTTKMNILGSGEIGIGTTSPDRLLHSEISGSATTTIGYPFRASHITSGTAASGFGSGIEFEAESAGGTNRVAGTIENPYTTATNAAEVSDLVFKTMRAGTLTESLRSLGNGTLQIGTLTGTATQLMGATSTNIATAVTLGAGLSFSSGTLNGAFLPLTLTGATEVNTAGQNLYFRDAAGYPFTFMNNNYWVAASSVNNYIDVGSTASNVQLISDGLIWLNSSLNLELQSTGRTLIDADSIVIEATLPVNTNATHVLVRDASTQRLEEFPIGDVGTWLKPELEAGNSVSITGDEANDLGIFGLKYLGLGVEKNTGDTQRAFIEMSSDDGAGTVSGDTILGTFYGGTSSDVVAAMYLLKSGTTRIKGETEVYVESPNIETSGAVQVGDITNGDGVTLAAYTLNNTLTSVTIDGTGNTGLLFDDGALTLSNNLSEVADTVIRTLGTGQQIYTNGYAAYSGNGFSYSSGRITNASGATRLCKIRYYFTAETAGTLTDALTIRVMIWDGATYTEHRAGRLTMTLNDDWELTGSKETIITLPDGDGVNIAFDSTDGLDVSNFGYVIEKI